MFNARISKAVHRDFTAAHVQRLNVQSGAPRFHSRACSTAECAKRCAEISQPRMFNGRMCKAVLRDFTAAHVQRPNVQSGAPRSHSRACSTAACAKRCTEISQPRMFNGRMCKAVLRDFTDAHVQQPNVQSGAPIFHSHAWSTVECAKRSGENLQLRMFKERPNVQSGAQRFHRRACSTTECARRCTHIS